MSRLKGSALAVSLVAGFISGMRVQGSSDANGTANAAIVTDDGSTIVGNHSRFFGSEGITLAGSIGFSGSAAKIPTNLSGGNASVFAVGEPGYEVNVCISLTSEMVSRDGSGGKLRGGVNLGSSRRGFSNRTTALQNGT